MTRAFVGAAAVAVVLGVCTSSVAGARPATSAFHRFHWAGLTRPQGIAVAADGALWVTSPGAHSITRLTPAGGTHTFTSPLIGPATAIVAGPDGAFWFANGPSSIGRITAAGAVTTFAIPGGEAVQLAFGADGALWFTTGGKAIGRLAPDGSATLLADPARMRGTMGIARGQDGAVWFTNYLGSSIGRVAADGTVTVFTSPHIRYPTAIAPASDGALWFADDSGAIGRITTSGTVSAYGTAATVGHPVAIAAGRDGAAWAADRGGAIVRVTARGAISRYADATIRFPTGIAAGRGGALWVTNYAGNSVVRFTPSLAKTQRRGAVARPRVTLISDSVAAAIAFDAGAEAMLAESVDLFLEPGQARQLGGVNPVGGIAPPTAVDLIPALGRRLGPTVIISIGDNDVPSQYATELEIALAELHAAGVHHVLWVTLHVSPDHTSYQTMDDAIAAAAARHPELTVVDWNAYAGAHPEWFLADGVHLNGDGPRALAGLLHAGLVRAGITRPPATARP